MNRIIKFRAWDKKGKMMLDNVSTGTVLIWGDDGYQAKAKDCEFMQFTGLKDKNGKEIYEGDIVTSKCPSNPRAECYFEEGCFQFKGTGCDLCDEYLSNKVLVDFEVIGNIYENKDLLESSVKNG